MSYRQIRNSLSEILKAYKTLRSSVRTHDAIEPRKVSKFSNQSPYRKPTQVGGMSILRRVEELSLRNSAK
ncbi:hypothetical protein CSPB_1489 [Campylobacter sputorum subsp. bovis]|nr:hypothetical protein CSPB_0593 [Campylobacter sputorum]ASM40100.1 hypothetical protein CSPB_0878 [Campylobacter sputorum]ASM40668.1 hypothetical protein CSPB_1489 [Campylobacter sputorum]